MKTPYKSTIHHSACRPMPVVIDGAKSDLQGLPKHGVVVRASCGQHYARHRGGGRMTRVVLDDTHGLTRDPMARKMSKKRRRFITRIRRIISGGAPPTRFPKEFAKYAAAQAAQKRLENPRQQKQTA